VRLWKRELQRFANETGLAPILFTLRGKAPMVATPR
jgi:hypothetical protein